MVSRAFSLRLVWAFFLLVRAPALLLIVCFDALASLTILSPWALTILPFRAFARLPLFRSWASALLSGLLLGTFGGLFVEPLRSPRSKRVIGLGLLLARRARRLRLLPWEIRVVALLSLIWSLLPLLPQWFLVTARIAHFPLERRC